VESAATVTDVSANLPIQVRVRGALPMQFVIGTPIVPIDSDTWCITRKGFAKWAFQDGPFILVLLRWPPKPVRQ
jgi:hypothetical protein